LTEFDFLSTVPSNLFPIMEELAEIKQLQSRLVELYAIIESKLHQKYADFTKEKEEWEKTEKTLPTPNPPPLDVVITSSPENRIDLLRENAELKQRLHEKESLASDYDKLKKKIVAEGEALNEQLSNSKKTVEKAEKQKRLIEEELKSFKKDNNDFQRVKMKMAVDLEKAQNEVRRLKIKTEDDEHTIEESENKSKRLESQVKTVNEAVEKLNTDVTKLKTDLQNEEEAHAKLKKKLDALFQS